MSSSARSCLLLGVLQPTLESLFPLEELFAIDRQRLELLLQPQLFSLQRQIALFRLATLVLLLTRLFTGIENLPLLEIRRVAQIEDVLVLLVDDLAQVDDLAIAKQRRTLALTADEASSSSVRSSAVSSFCSANRSRSSASR
jgi:hypothetical protein